MAIGMNIKSCVNACSIIGPDAEYQNCISQCLPPKLTAEQSEIICKDYETTQLKNAETLINKLFVGPVNYDVAPYYNYSNDSRVRADFRAQDHYKATYNALMTASTTAAAAKPGCAEIVAKVYNGAADVLYAKKVYLVEELSTDPAELMFDGLFDKAGGALATVFGGGGSLIGGATTTGAVVGGAYGIGILVGVGVLASGGRAFGNMVRGEVAPISSQSIYCGSHYCFRGQP